MATGYKATAIALGMTVVTANVTDFRKIGTVGIEDWTVDSDIG
jgi:predicted nucleic acid-binding protein